MMQVHRQAVTMFNEAKSEMMQQAVHAQMYPNLPTPGEGDEQYLRELAAKAGELKAKSDAIKAALLGRPEGKYRQAAREHEERRRREAAEAAKKIRDINL